MERKCECQDVKAGHRMAKKLLEVLHDACMTYDMNMLMDDVEEALGYFYDEDGNETDTYSEPTEERLEAEDLDFMIHRLKEAGYVVAKTIDDAIAESNGRFAHHMDEFYAQQKGESVKTIRFCPNCGQAVGNGEHLSQHDGMEWYCEKCGMVFDVIVYDEPTDDELKDRRIEYAKRTLNDAGYNIIFKLGEPYYSMLCNDVKERNDDEMAEGDLDFISPSDYAKVIVEDNYDD